METKKTNKKGQGTTKWFATRQGTALISIIIAVLIWFTVVTVIEPGSTTTFHVPVDFSFNEAAYTSQGLSIVETPTRTVEVTVQGDGSVLAGMTESDILVYPEYTMVSGAGTYNLRIIVRNAGTKYFEIVEDDIGYVELTFDKFIQRDFNISVNVMGVQTADGYYMDVPSVSPQTVTLHGPEKTITPITNVIANVTLDEERQESAIVTASLSYLDEAGTVLDKTGITASVDQVEVTVPIYRIKELPLTVEFSGVPTGFDPTVLSATLSNKTIRVAGPSTQLDEMQSISAGVIDLSKFDLSQQEIPLDIVLPENIKNVDNLQKVTVTFDGTQDFITQEFTVTEVQAINVPENIEVSFPTAQINNVTLVGDATELEELTETSVVGVVDFSPTNLAVTSGQQNLSVQIRVLSGDTVFATGSYTIICDIKTVGESTQAHETIEVETE